MDKLKPCPFCGGEAKLKRGNPCQQNCGKRIAFVQCRKCKAKTQTFSQLAYESWQTVESLAVSSWNTRSGGDSSD